LNLHADVDALLGLSVAESLHISSDRAPQTPLVQRRYRADDKRCIQAVELLLKKAGAAPAGDDDRRRVKDASPAEEKYT
jgi:hypothetical protein